MSAPNRNSVPFVGPAPPPVGQRPRCPNCRTELRPWIKTEERRVQTGQEFRMKAISRSWSTLGWRAYGHFCSLRCACDYANRVFTRAHGPAPTGPADVESERA